VTIVSQADAGHCIFVSAAIAAKSDLARRPDSDKFVDLKDISIWALQFVGLDIIGTSCNFVAAFTTVPNT